MWIYEQSTGVLRKQAEVCGIGYSGKGLFKNKPECQSDHNLGPLPRGFYEMQTPEDTPLHGPYAIPLKPDMDNQMFGRSGFMIHGDSIHDPGGASDGCIILAHEVRVSMWNSGDRLLQVVE